MVECGIAALLPAEQLLHPLQGKILSSVASCQEKVDKWVGVSEERMLTPRDGRHVIGTKYDDLVGFKRPAREKNKQHKLQVSGET